MAVALTADELEAHRTNLSSSDCGAQLADGTRFQPMGRTTGGEAFVSMCKGQTVQGHYGALHVICGRLEKGKAASPGPIPAAKFDLLLAHAGSGFAGDSPAAALHALFHGPAGHRVTESFPTSGNASYTSSYENGSGRDVALNLQRWFGNDILTQHLAAICFVLRRCAPHRLDEFKDAVADPAGAGAPPGTTVSAARTTIGQAKQSHGGYHVNWCGNAPDDTAAFNLQRLAYVLVGIAGAHTPTPPSAGAIVGASAGDSPHPAPLPATVGTGRSVRDFLGTLNFTATEQADYAAAMVAAGFGSEAHITSLVGEGTLQDTTLVLDGSGILPAHLWMIWKKAAANAVCLAA